MENHVSRLSEIINNSSTSDLKNINGTFHSRQRKNGNSEVKIDISTVRIKLTELLKPTLVLLTIAGCYNYGSKGDNSYSSKCNVIGLIYRTFCFLSCLAFCAKGIAASIMAETQTAMNFHILFTMWYFQCIFVYLIFLKSYCTKYGHLDKAMEFWDTKIGSAMESLNIDFSEAKVKKRQNIYITIAAIVTAINCISLGIVSIFSQESRDLSVAPFDYSIILSVVFSVLTTPLTFLWIFPVFSVMTISNLLTTVLEDYNTFTEKYISQTLQSKTCKVYFLRTLHLNICKMVTYLDSDLGYYYASSFVFSIGISCYILYQVIKLPMTLMNQLVFLSWLVGQLGSLAAMSVAAAFVHEAAHGSLDILYYLCIPDINKEQLAQINLFLFKLTGSPVGFTTAGLLTITKEFLLTITGVFLTYFFLLYTLP